MATSSGAWTAFVDNLSRRVTRGALWELFNHHGKVNRVFIPVVNKKPRYKFSTFSFVQFASPGDLDRVIRSTNKSKIDGRVIVVSKARFSIRQEENTHDPPQVNKVGDKPDVGISRKSTLGAADRFASVVDNRSYMEVLLGKPKAYDINKERNFQRVAEAKRGDNMSSPSNFYFPTSDSSWIDSALVGIARQIFDLDFVQNAISSDGIIAKVARWGNVSNSCIIIFNSCVEKEAAWNEKKEALSFWFDYIAPIKNANGISASFYFVSLTGVPLHCWHECFFKALGNKWVTIRSKGRIFIIKTQLASSQPISQKSSQDRNQEKFTDVWLDCDLNEVDTAKETNCHNQIDTTVFRELPSGKNSLTCQGACRNVLEPTFDLDHEGSALSSNLREGRNEDVPISNSPFQFPVDHDGQMGVGHVVNVDGSNVGWLGNIPTDITHLGLALDNSLDTDGPGNSFESVPIQHHNSLSSEFVPDSFDGLENHLEGHTISFDSGNSKRNMQRQSPILVVSQKPISHKRSENSFFNSSHRREIRRFCGNL
ncbi:hypothetical protein V6N13_114684 [Hibiscus sabdariffa]